MHVRKIPVRFVVKDGVRTVYADGKPVLFHPKILKDETAGTRCGGDGNDLLLGCFADVGVGLGIALDSGLAASSKETGSTSSVSGGGILGSVTYYSSVDLGAEDFDGAWFHLASTNGPGAAVGSFVSFAGSYQELNLRSGLQPDILRRGQCSV